MKWTEKQVREAINKNARRDTEKPLQSTITTESSNGKDESKESIVEDVMKSVTINQNAQQVIYRPDCIACMEKNGRCIKVTAEVISKAEFLALVPKKKRL